MAGKRRATSDLNHDNWDREDDVEEAGTFKKAADDVLKRRVIKTARRHNPLATGNGEEGQNNPVFGGFTGFSSFAPPNPNAAFSFLNNTNTVKSPPLATSSTTAKVCSPSTPSKLTNGVESKSQKNQKIVQSFSMDETGKSMDNIKQDNDSDDRIEYFAKLRGLNESVLDWIDKHVKENPFINLKPIFTDYERYLSELEVKHVTVSADTKRELAGFSFKPLNKVEALKSTTLPTFTSTNASIFGPTANEKSADKVEKAASGNSSFLGESGGSRCEKFSFGVPTSTIAGASTTSTDKETGKAPSFVFGSANAGKSAPSSEVSKPFAFGSGSTGLASTPGSLFGIKASSTPFSFGTSVSSAPTFSSTPAAAQSETINLDEDDDEPPEVQFTPVVEQDHIYTIRCKVFVKKDGNFGDRGVGNLYLKKVPESEKVQLIVRADTNLGNLLCNLILSEAVPTQRMGKKDVMLVCIPMPDEKPPPVPVLLRVKGEAEADALLKELEKHKKIGSH